MIKNFLWILALTLIFISCTKPKNIENDNIKQPLTKNQIQARKNFINGTSAECMMDVFFLYDNNWQKIEGENGTHGIDGLYIKTYHDDITDVLVTESKWNSSRLKNTKKGTTKQMSKAWILDKLKKAKPYNPDIKNFDQISTFVKHDTYRARLFKLKPLDADKLKIILYRIKNKSNDRDVEKVDKSEIYLDVKHPKNLFHKKMIEAYSRCKDRATQKWLPNLNEKR